MHKIYRLIAVLFLAIGFSSCTSYYQLFEVDSPDIILFENDYFVDTSSRLHIIYDFWSDGGIPIIEIVNEETDTVLLDFKKSSFTVNQDKFSFAPKTKTDSIRKFSNEEGYNVMFDMMPGSVFLPPDSSFVFEGIAWNYEWSSDVSKNNPTKRYVYTSSPYRMDHTYVYHLKNTKADTVAQSRTDKIIHRMYLSKVTELEEKVYKATIRSELLSNKFYLTPESGLTDYDKFNIAETLMSLLLGQ